MTQKLKEKQVRNRITRRQAIRMGGLAAAGLVFTKPIIESIQPPPVHASISAATRTPTLAFNCRAVLTRNGVILQEKVYQAIQDHSEVRSYNGFTLTIDCQPA